MTIVQYMMYLIVASFSVFKCAYLVSFYIPIIEMHVCNMVVVLPNFTYIIQYMYVYCTF